MRATTFTAITVATLLASGVARADDAEAADAAFKRGIALMESGAVNEACIAFEQSQRLEAKAGTLLNLAGCYERASRWEDAYRAFESAREASRERQRADWVTLATEHMAALKPKLAFVTVDASAISKLPGARVTVDGRAIPEREQRDGVALGPGMHIIRAEATGYRWYEQTITTPPGARLELPQLERDPAAPAAAVASPARATQATPTEHTESGSSGRKTIGLVVGGVGIAALGFGAVGGVFASDALSDAKSACTSYPDRCSPDATGPNDRATTWSTLSTVSLAGGAVLVAAGLALYLWPTSSSAKASAPRRGTTVSVGAGGVGLNF